MPLTPYKSAVLATSGLVSLWPLDEASGEALDAADSNPGTLTGGTRAQTSLLPNGEGASLLLPGSGKVEVPSAANLEIGDVLSVELWVAITDLSKYAVWVDLGGSGTLALGFDKVTGKVYTTKTAVAAMYESNTAIADTKPHHVVATKNGATTKIYIDGVDVGVTGTNATCAADSNTKRIGQYYDGSEQTYAYMQFAAVYNTAISKATVEAHYAAGSEEVSEPLTKGLYIYRAGKWVEV